MSRQMVATPDNFDGAAAIFLEHANTLRGYIRYEASHRNLELYLPKSKKARVLDIGGGNGLDTAWLAVLGYRVTFLEISKEQSLHAERRFNFFLDDDQRQRITVIEGSIDRLADDDTFDIVLMHGVTMYQKEPNVFVANALRHLKPGGLISLLDRGYYGAEARAIRREDHIQLHDLRVGSTIINRIGLVMRVFKPEEIEAILVTNDCTILEWSGLRVISDEMEAQTKDVPESVLAEILASELHQGHHPGIRAQGQLLQFIARKN